MCTPLQRTTPAPLSALRPPLVPNPRQVLPRAVEWFTGEAVPPEYDDEFDGEYEDEDEEQ